jgi:hypothetical protein
MEKLEALKAKLDEATKEPFVKAVIVGWQPIYVNPDWDEAAKYVNLLFQRLGIRCERVPENDFELIKSGLKAIQKPWLFERTEEGLLRIKKKYVHYRF